MRSIDLDCVQRRKSGGGKQDKTNAKTTASVVNFAFIERFLSLFIEGLQVLAFSNAEGEGSGLEVRFSWNERLEPPRWCSKQVTIGCRACTPPRHSLWLAPAAYRARIHSPRYLRQ